MLAEADLQEYLEEIRQEVCSRCVERPPDGPPCAPLGKPCGVEMHLPQLVDAIHEVHSDLIAPYLDNNRRRICQSCTFLHSTFCPCPMDYLAVLVVEAVEAVDGRRERRGQGGKLLSALPGSGLVGREEVATAYEAATGTWVGCDWPAPFGPGGLDLQGISAGEAESRAVEAPAAERDDWGAAACWLREVERRAALAQAQASLAVAAANAGEWGEAVKHARRAWALEFTTGRHLRHSALTWRPLYQAIKAAAHAERAEPPSRLSPPMGAGAVGEGRP
jgi:hypothetical protein